MVTVSIERPDAKGDRRGRDDQEGGGSGAVSERADRTMLGDFTMQGRVTGGLPLKPPPQKQSDGGRNVCQTPANRWSWPDRGEGPAGARRSTATLSPSRPWSAVTSMASG